MKKSVSHILLLIFVLFNYCSAMAQQKRELIKMDDNWRFSFGHQYDTDKDFGHGTAYFSYLAKTGNGDGPAASNFDDRAWRMLNLPHDWAVEQGFEEKASFSHGFKAVGKGYPEKNID